MSAYRENAAGEFEVLAHPWKGWYELAIAAAIGAAAGVAIALDPRNQFVWLLGLVPLALAVYAVRDLRRGRSQEPMLTIGPSGVRGESSGATAAWDEVERVELFDWGFGASVSRYAAFHLSEPTPIGPPGFNVDLSRLATTEEEFVGVLRRFWDGPIDGYRGELPTRYAPIRRLPRWRRFLRWARLPAFGIGFGLAVFLLLQWADP